MAFYSFANSDWTRVKSSLVTPDFVLAPDDKKTWLKKVGEDLEEWVIEEGMLSNKSLREAWTEGIKIKRNIEKEVPLSYSKIAAS